MAAQQRHRGRLPIDEDEIPRQLIYAQYAAGIEAQTIDLLPSFGTESQKGSVIAESVAGVVSRAYANDRSARTVPALCQCPSAALLPAAPRGL